MPVLTSNEAVAEAATRHPRIMYPPDRGATVPAARKSRPRRLLRDTRNPTAEG